MGIFRTLTNIYDIQSLTIISKRSILDVLLCSEYASDFYHYKESLGK